MIADGGSEEVKVSPRPSRDPHGPVARQSTTCYDELMAKIIAQHQFRNDIAKVIEAVAAHPNGITPYTRNPGDFARLSDLVQVSAI